MLTFAHVALGRRVPALLALGVLVASLAIVSCGSDTPKTVTQAPKAQGAAGELPPNVVLDEDISRTKKGTPAAGLLRWWQALQFQDIETVRQLTADATSSADVKRLPGDLAKVAGLLGKPKVVAESTDGPKSSIRVLIQTFTAGSRRPTSTVPYTFRLLREDSTWKVRNLNYLFDVARQVADGQGP